MIRSVIFDLDGVLVDAVEWHYLALNRALSHFGYAIPASEHASLYNGLPTAVKLELVSQRKGFPRALHAITCELKQKYTRQIIETSCTPDIRLLALLRHLKAKGFRLGVASNSIASTVSLCLEKMALREYFDVVLSNQDVQHPKPNCEIYSKALRLLETAPEECLILEDSIPGIQAARAVTSNVMIVTRPSEVTLELVLNGIAEFGKAHRFAPRESMSAPRNEIQVLIPLAGLGQRFVAAGFAAPKPLIEIKGKPMIQWVVDNLRPLRHASNFTFLCNEKHLREFPLEHLLLQVAPHCQIVPVPSVTEGAACTTLLAKGHIDPNRPLLIANSDQWIESEIDVFLDKASEPEIDGLILTFPAKERKWSYAKVDGNGRVVEVAEKNPISENATVGVYYFSHAKDFFEGAERMIRKDIRTNGEFYVCPVYNELIQLDKNIRILGIQPELMHGLGTPEDLAVFLESGKGQP